MVESTSKSLANPPIKANSNSINSIINTNLNNSHTNQNLSYKTQSNFKSLDNFHFVKTRDNSNKDDGQNELIKLNNLIKRHDGLVVAALSS